MPEMTTTKNSFNNSSINSSSAGGGPFSLTKAKWLVLIVSAALFAYMLLVPGPQVRNHAWTRYTQEHPSSQRGGDTAEPHATPTSSKSPTPGGGEAGGEAAESREASARSTTTTPISVKGTERPRQEETNMDDAGKREESGATSAAPATPAPMSPRMTEEVVAEQGGEFTGAKATPLTTTTTGVKEHHSTALPGDGNEMTRAGTQASDPIPTSPPKSSQGEAVLPDYMHKLQDKYDFDLRTSFSGWTLDYALGPQGILVKVEDRYKRSADDGIHRVIRSKQKYAWPPPSASGENQSSSPSSEEKEEYVFLRKKAKFLGLEGIATKYGLTNVLMVLSGFFAYGGIANRIAVFPKNSPLPLEDLLDINETQAMLAPLNVVILDPGNESDIVDLGPNVTARSRGISLGKRSEIGSPNKNVAEKALRHQVSGMRKVSKTRYFVQRDFFLTFPFGAIAPFGHCFMIRRLVFTKAIRNAATGVMRALRDGHVVIDNSDVPLVSSNAAADTSVSSDQAEATPSPREGAAGPAPNRTSGKRIQVNRLMAVHLRLEFDAFLLDRSVTTLSPDEVTRFFMKDLIPLAQRADCDAIYICAGKLETVTMDAIKLASSKSGGFPLITKDMIPNVKWRKNLNRQTTSHAGAAADLLIMAHSALAVVFRHSSFWISVAAHRCPSPGYGKNASYSRWKVDDTHGEALVPWSVSSSLPPSAGEGEKNIGDPSSLHGPKPDFNALLGGSPWKSKSEPGGKGQDRWHSGFFGYTLGQNSNVPEEKPRFSRLHYLGCDQSFGTRCFHDQMLMSPTDGQPIVGDTYGNEFGH